MFRVRCGHVQPCSECFDMGPFEWKLYNNVFLINKCYIVTNIWMFLDTVFTVRYCAILHDTVRCMFLWTIFTLIPTFDMHCPFVIPFWHAHICANRMVDVILKSNRCKSLAKGWHLSSSYSSDYVRTVFSVINIIPADRSVAVK